MDRPPSGVRRVKMSDTIIAKSDQLNAEDLMEPITIKVTGVKIKKGSDQPAIINFEGDKGKPYKPGLTCRRILARLWGDCEDGADTYNGRLITLYVDPTVKWGGQAVGGLRISHMSHIDQDTTLPLTVTRGVKKPYTIKRLDAQQSQQQTGQPDIGAIMDAITRASEVATGGSQAFNNWWKSDEGVRLREHFGKDEAEMAKLRVICGDADQRIQEELANTANDVFADDGNQDA